MNKISNHINAGLLACMFCFAACSKSGGSTTTPPPPVLPVALKSIYLNNVSFTNTTYNINGTPLIKVQFSQPVLQSSVSASVTLTGGGGTVQLTTGFLNNDSVVTFQPAASLKYLARYTFAITTALQSKAGGHLISNVQEVFYTQIDSTDKFPQLSDSALLTLVQQQTFNYFWNFGHPVSGMARERTSSNDVVTTGGSGFGIMSMLVGVQRNFITRADALTRIDTIVSFLTHKVTRYHGAFPHWINGSTGATVPFGTEDDGGDIVETSYMIQGLLCARQFFNSNTDSNEIRLRNSINSISDSVQWNWYRQNNQNVLTWNWSPQYNWSINVQVSGWDEALITYVLAASSNTPSNRIPKIVYDNGWAGNGAMKNGKTFFGVNLPLGPDYGGPLFFAHYSFLGINPQNLSDAYADYWTQDTAHATINYLYCVNNPNHNFGYSNLCWGLTASDIQGGYTASSPTNDVGVIAPTAAIASLPYTPVQSMNALRFFYYKLGDRIWGPYGFIDAFNLNNLWFDSDCLAIDQGPEIVMIENYRSGLLWNLFMSCPEVKTGMKNLGFTSPNL
ncbi:MAG TPA: beta-glucosidase [Chitinophagaceae bacterium]|nr:beta-glucosidase [Chitinophagaceae bacterium]